MPVTLNIHEAKTHFSKIIARVQRGEDVVIAMAGKPVARVVPISGPGLTPIFSATLNVSISPAGDTDETEELHRRADHSCPARG